MLQLTLSSMVHKVYRWEIFGDKMVCQYTQEYGTAHVELPVASRFVHSWSIPLVGPMDTGVDHGITRFTPGRNGFLNRWSLICPRLSKQAAC